MNNENTSIFENDAANNIIEEEIVLAPPTEWIEEAEAIAQNTQDNEKFPFMLAYDANQNEFLLSMLQTAGAIVVKDDEEYHLLSTRMNMAQLALIKRLDCVKRVITDEGTNPFLAEEAEKSVPTQWNMQENGEPLDDGQNGPSLNMGEASLEIAAGLAALEVEKQNANGIAAASAAAAASATGSCCNCPTNVSMKTAAVVSDESYTSGYICCPGAAQWFKFTATRSGQYTICTTGSLDTIGTLYDCSGNLIVEVDDYAPCGKINFRIIRNLTAGCTYYVKVRLHNNNTGTYALKVTDKVLVNYVTINKDTIVLEKDVLYELPLTANYTYKGYLGAKRIPELSVSLFPSNADEQKILWWEQYGDVLQCFHGRDNNGDRYIHVMASETGTAKLYAQDWNENGKRDECNITVFSRECVEIVPDTLDNDFNMIRFNSTGKIWHCVDHDLLFKDDYWKDDKDYYTNRALLNCADWDENGFQYIDSEKTYTDDELLLLYALDPYGVAYYVHWYATYGQPGHGPLANTLKYKDRIFKLLFKRDPKYFARYEVESWYTISDISKISDLRAVISESEMYFGMHPFSDLFTKIALLQIAFEIVLMAVGGAANFIKNEVVKKIITYSIRAIGLSEGLLTDGVFNASFDLALDIAEERTNINWVGHILTWKSACDTLDELAETIVNNNTFYTSYIQYVANIDTYRVIVQNQNGRFEMQDLNEAIKALA